MPTTHIIIRVDNGVVSAVLVDDPNIEVLVDVMGDFSRQEVEYDPEEVEAVYGMA